MWFGFQLNIFIHFIHSFTWRRPWCPGNCLTLQQPALAEVFNCTQSTWSRLSGFCLIMHAVVHVSIRRILEVRATPDRLYGGISDDDRVMKIYTSSTSILRISPASTASYCCRRNVQHKIHKQWRIRKTIKQTSALPKRISLQTAP